MILPSMHGVCAQSSLSHQGSVLEVISPPDTDTPTDVKILFLSLEEAA